MSLKCYEGTIDLGVQGGDWNQTTCEDGIHFCKNMTGGKLNEFIICEF